MDWLQLILTVLPILLGIGFIGIRLEKILKAFVELSQVLTVINESLQDKKLTPEEIATIKKEVAEAIAAFKAIFTK